MSEEEVVRSLTSRQDGLGLGRVSDASSMAGPDVRLHLVDGADLDDVVARVAQVWGVTRTVDCDYGRPIVELFGDWLDENDPAPGTLELLAG